MCTYVVKRLENWSFGEPRNQFESGDADAGEAQAQAETQLAEAPAPGAARFLRAARSKEPVSGWGDCTQNRLHGGEVGAVAIERFVTE